MKTTSLHLLQTSCAIFFLHRAIFNHEHSTVFLHGTVHFYSANFYAEQYIFRAQNYLLTATCMFYGGNIESIPITHTKDYHKN